MSNLNPNQKLLLSAEYLLDVNPLKKYETLFSNLNCSPIESLSLNGRPSTSPSGLLNESFQIIRRNLVNELISLDAIKGKSLAIDSAAIFAEVRENNLKTSVKERFNKEIIPKGDTDCRLGVYIEFPQPFKKEVNYFWGYRNHIICDADSELPVEEITKPASVSEQSLFISLFKQVQQDFSFAIEIVLGDAMYDVEYLLKFVINELKAKPYIARNPRWTLYSDVKLSETGGLICVAGFNMVPIIIGIQRSWQNPSKICLPNYSSQKVRQTTPLVSMESSQIC